MKNQKGITLIALIITIIVMLILVTVSITIALNTGLFQSAQTAASGMETAKTQETGLSNGQVNINVGAEQKPLDLTTQNMLTYNFATGTAQ